MQDNVYEALHVAVINTVGGALTMNVADRWIASVDEAVLGAAYFVLNAPTETVVHETLETALAAFCDQHFAADHTAVCTLMLGHDGVHSDGYYQWNDTESVRPRKPDFPRRRRPD